MNLDDMLHPIIVRYLLDLMTEKEIDELKAFCSAEAASPEVYCARANEWLRRRFPNLVVVESSVEEIVRRSEKAGMN
jgi:hypothetical protein